MSIELQSCNKETGYMLWFDVTLKVCVLGLKRLLSG